MIVSLSASQWARTWSQSVGWPSGPTQVLTSWRQNAISIQTWWYFKYTQKPRDFERCPDAKIVVWRWAWVYENHNQNSTVNPLSHSSILVIQWLGNVASTRDPSFWNTFKAFFPCITGPGVPSRVVFRGQYNLSAEREFWLRNIQWKGFFYKSMFRTFHNTIYGIEQSTSPPISTTSRRAVHIIRQMSPWSCEALNFKLYTEYFISLRKSCVFALVNNFVCIGVILERHCLWIAVLKTTNFFDVN